jgi:hypothetical protein
MMATEAAAAGERTLSRVRSSFEVDRLLFESQNTVMSSPEDPNVIAWRRYQRLRNYAIVAIAGYLPLGCLLALSLGWIEPHMRERLIVGFAVAWLVFLAVAWSRFASFACPRCNRRFFVPAVSAWGPRGNIFWIFRPACANCGLRKYSAET